MRAALRDEVAAYTARCGAPPCLVALGSAAAPAADTWLTLKLDAARNAGIRLEPVLLPAASTTAAAIASVHRAGDDPSVHGVFVQYPLPGIDVQAVFDAIPVHKDVDGASTEALRRLRSGAEAFVPASAAAVMALLRDAAVDLGGTRAFVGRGASAIADPLVLLLERAGSVVERVEEGSGPEAVRAALQPARIVIFPAGISPEIQPQWLPADAVVVDAGYFGGGRAGGEAVLAEAAPRLSAYVPGRGGVGPVTVEFLLRHTLEAAQGRLAGG